MRDMATTAGAAPASPAGHTPVLRSPLESALKQLTPVAAQRQAGVLAAEWPNLGGLVVRGQASDAAFMSAVSSVLGTALPTRPSTWVSVGRTVVMWMGPDEWWLLLPRSERDELLGALVSALQGLFAQVVDNSGGLTCLRLAGPEHLTVLRHLSPYDVESVELGACISTVIPKGQLTMVRVDEAGVVLVFRRSFADWIWRLIQRSAEPYGLAICTPQQLVTPVFSALLAGGAR